MKCLNKKQILIFGLILNSLCSITPISAENVKPSVEIGDELVYDVQVIGDFDGADEEYSYMKMVINDIINETDDGMTNVLFDIYTSNSTTSWNDTPPLPEEEKYVLTNATEITDAIVKNANFPSILVKPGLKIGTLATEIATLLTTHYSVVPPVTSSSINNSYGVRFEMAQTTQNISMEYIYNEDGILFWCEVIYEIDSEDNALVQLSLLTINDLPIEFNPTDTETTDTETTDTETTDTENPNNIPGYPFMAVIVISCMFIFLKHKKRYLNTL